MNAPSGRIVFNGNIETEQRFVERVRPLLTDRPPRGEHRRVVLITAAWEAHEHEETHVKRALNEAGISSVFEHGFDRAIENLSVWHAFRSLLQRRRHLAEQYEEMRALRAASRSFYLERTAFHAQLVRKGVHHARSHAREFALGATHDGAASPLRGGRTLDGATLLARVFAREIDDSIASLVNSDHRMLQVFREVEALFRDRTGLRLDPEWRRQREALEAKLLHADAIFLFGGSPDALMGSLGFFDLRPAFLEALRRGTTLFAVSAGALVLCERIVVFDDFAAQRGAHEREPDRETNSAGQEDFRLLDRGLGLVHGLQVFPHCMDRIQTDDADNLAYLARRFGEHTCVGLNQESFLLVEGAPQRALSIGAHDGVYVFRRDGVKRCLRQGELLDWEG